MEETFIVTAVHREEKKVLAMQMRRDMTPCERLLWQHLRANRLGGLHFRRQQIIDGFIVDFFCHAARIVVELDGSAHEGREEYDAERESILAAHGLCVLRFTNDALITNRNAVLHRILSIARERLPPSLG